MDAQHAWKAALSQLEIQLDRATFDTWLRGAVLLGCETQDDTTIFVIGAKHNYARDMLQHRLYRTIKRILSDVCEAAVEMRFEVHRPRPVSEEDQADMPLFRLLREAEAANTPAASTPTSGGHWNTARPERPALPESELNPRFVFDRFIGSPGNRIAYEAARAVSEYPASAYNPLFLHSSVGMGKTHLLQAIAHVCIARGLRALYIPSEVFTNDLIDAIRNRSTAMFRERYRSADVLLVDDIQFMAGKESTQEEFFHTFNALVTYNKQVVLASDRPPHLLATLEDRLRSRFAGGLVVDIQPADLETRIAILQLWAQERGVDLPIETAEALAMRAPNNCRELEGVFNQLVAKARLNRGGLTVDAAYATVEAFERPREYLTLARLLDATARCCGVTTRDLTGQKRSSRINTARQVAMFLARDLLELSLTQIGEAFGGRSHSTVLHGCNKMAEELDHDARLRSTVDLIKRQLKK